MIPVIYLVNSMVAVVLLSYEFHSRSDKTILITSFLLAILAGVNIVLGLVRQIRRKPNFYHFYLCGLLVVTTALVAFFL